MPIHEDSNTLDWYAAKVAEYMVPYGYRVPQEHRTPGDATPEATALNELKDHQTEFFLNGSSYISRLDQEMQHLTQNPNGAYFWIHGWCFELYTFAALFDLSGRQLLPEDLKSLEADDTWTVYNEGQEVAVAGTSLVTRMQQMLAAGVDVRVIGWLSPSMVRYEMIVKRFMEEVTLDRNGTQVEVKKAKEFLNRNLLTLYSLLKLREDLNAAARVVFNTRAHPLGATHTKFVVAGNAQYRQVYTGGVDIMESRNKATWHDATVAFEGPTTSQAYDFFKYLWNDINDSPVVQLDVNIRDFDTDAQQYQQTVHPSHSQQRIVDSPTFMPAITSVDTAGKRVQMFRTIPRKFYEETSGRYRKAAMTLLSAQRYGASLNGKRILKRAKAMADIPDMWTTLYPPHSYGLFEFKTVCYKAIANAKKYICICDQEIMNFELLAHINQRLRTAPPAERPKVILLSKLFITGSTTSTTDLVSKGFQEKLMEGISSNFRNHLFWGELSTHAKIVLIDDVWASVGSANAMRRSFYTDVEMGVAILDKTAILEFRNSLWQGFCSNGPNRVPDNIDQALGIWNPDWTANTQNLPTLSSTIIKGRLTKKPSTNFFRSFRLVDHFAKDPDSNHKL